MLLIFILNIVFSAAVVIAVVGLLGSAIASEQGRSRVRRRLARRVAWPAARWSPQGGSAYPPR